MNADSLFRSSATKLPCALIPPKHHRHQSFDRHDRAGDREHERNFGKFLVLFPQQETDRRQSRCEQSDDQTE